MAAPIYYVRNIGERHGFILQHTLAPGETLDLEKLFRDFCKPKINKNKEVLAPPQFEKDNFEGFLSWVSDIVVDRGRWELVYAERHVPAKIKEPHAVVNRKNKLARGTEKARATLKAKDLTSKDIAWLPYDAQTKKIVEECNDAKKLKAALRLVKTLAGQERLRKLLEDQVASLAGEGIG